MEEYGHVKIKLQDLSKAKLLSKDKFSCRAEIQQTQINPFCNDEITRLDTAVLSRICHALDCKIENLLEYIPLENE